MIQQNYIGNDYKLVNFNVPNYLINNFDEMVKFKRMSRTSTLIGLMELWLRSEVKKVESDNNFNNLIMDMKLRNKTTETLKTDKVNEEEFPPTPIFTVNDDYDWKERFR